MQEGRQLFRNPVTTPTSQGQRNFRRYLTYEVCSASGQRRLFVVGPANDHLSAKVPGFTKFFNNGGTLPGPGDLFGAEANFSGTDIQGNYVCLSGKLLLL